MPFPGLVVSGQVISAAHINAIRNALITWPGDVDADGFDLSDVGALTAATINASASLTTAYLAVSGALDGASAYLTGTLLVDGAVTLNSRLSVIEPLGLLNDENDVGWTKIRNSSSSGSTDLLLGMGTGFAYIQSRQNGTSWTSKPISMQPNGGDVHFGGGVKRTATPVHADNAAAVSAGLSAGTEYRTSTGVKMEVF
jgi:hypothetical protein